MSVSSTSKAARQGWNDAETDTVPFGVPSFSRTGLMDDLLAHYGEDEVRDTLDRILDDAERNEDYDRAGMWVSGAEMEDLHRRLTDFVAQQESRLPAHWQVEPKLVLALARDGKLTQKWQAFITTSAGKIGFADGFTSPEDAVDGAIADLPEPARRELESFRARQDAAGAELEEMAQTDR